MHVSSGMVYDDAEAIFSEIRKSGDALFEEAISVLMPSSAPLSFLSHDLYATTFPTPSYPSVAALNLASEVYADGADLVGLNTTFFPRRDVVKIPKEVLGALNGIGKEYEVQELKDGSGAYVVMDGREGAGVVRPLGSNEDDGPGIDTRVSGEWTLLKISFRGWVE